MNRKKELSHQNAFALIELVKKAAEQRKVGFATAVVDTHGELLAFLRIDGCPLPSINNAINKAFTAAREQTESANIGRASIEDPFPITNFGDLRYTGWGGGIPIRNGEEVVGALGVSGLPEAEDIEIARSVIAQFEKSTQQISD